MPMPTRMGFDSRAQGGLLSSKRVVPSAAACSTFLRSDTAPRSSGNHTPGCVSPANIAFANAAVAILHANPSLEGSLAISLTMPIIEHNSDGLNVSCIEQAHRQVCLCLTEDLMDLKRYQSISVLD